MSCLRFVCRIATLWGMATPTRELIELRLTGQSLAAYVARKRRAGQGWRRIADDIYADSGVAVSHTTVARWFPEKSAA